jgi:hypothetical protein
MPITDILARNARVYASETALIERDPANHNRRRSRDWQAFLKNRFQKRKAVSFYGDRLEHSAIRLKASVASCNKSASALR